MTALDVLDATSADAISGLCRRALDHPPTTDEIRDALFADDQPAIVRGDPAVGIVAAVPGEGGGFVRLLIVDPAHQGNGHGNRLLEAAERDLARGRHAPTTVTVGADPPYYLVPGVETTQTAMLCLLERRKYHRDEANFNMDVDLAVVPEVSGAPGVTEPVIAGPGDRDDVDAFMVANYANWRAEALRALAKGTLLVDRDAAGISGFCAWDVNRRGLVGPVAVRLDLIGKGIGVPLLLGALERMRAGGYGRVEVSWVGPIVPYARVGATVGRVFFVYRKTIKPSGGPS
jgi:predicted N-acetyltransferase YhbS